VVADRAVDPRQAHGRQGSRTLQAHDGGHVANEEARYPGIDQGVRRRMNMSDRKRIPGKFVWFELETNQTKKAQAFYGELFGWKVLPFTMGPETYEMIQAGATPDTMIGGYARGRGADAPSAWTCYVSVPDVDAAAKTAAANGAKVLI